jgi:hypothetical protein
MPFILHSPHPLSLGELRDGDQAHATDGGAKPDGLWFSVGDGADWRELCVDPEKRWSLDGLKYQIEIVFSERAKIWHVASASGIDALTAKYSSERNDGKQSIDWFQIAKAFEGIIIAPLCVERCKYEQTRWYNCCECSCGCVWHAAAVKCLRPLNY